jgi:hypothetical protein
MRNSIWVFYNPDFIASCIDSLFDNPFWVEDSEGNVEKLEDVNRITFLSHTLPSLGFFNLPLGNKLTPIQVNGNIAREVSIKDFREFLIYLLNRVPNGNKVLDRMTMQYSHFFDEKLLTSFRCSDATLLKDDRTTAYRYYQNGVVKVSSKCDGVTFIPYNDLDGLVWADRVINRVFNIDSFGNFDQESFLNDITENAGHHFHKWCQNLCKSRDHTGSWTYNRNRFKGLASGFGYLLHQFCGDQKCVILIDEHMKEGEANGRTGKSVVLNDALSHALKTEVIDAKAVTKKSQNTFLFNFVTPSTQHICFDDAHQDFDFSSLFSVITGSLLVNRKYGTMFQFGKNEKPKMSISSNHPIIGEGSSYEDRQHVVSVGDFYRVHKMELGKSPDKIHGGFLFDEDWGDENWMEFDSFCIKSLLYYLKNGLVNTGCGDKYHLHKLNASVGSANLVSTLHRFLETNVGKETYSHFVNGMNDVERDRCVRDFVEGHLNGETYTLTQITNGLHLVAKHFSYYINVGMKDRPQKRFGVDRKGVNLYVITDKHNPFKKPSINESGAQFPNSCDEENSLAAEIVISDEVKEIFSKL